MKEIQPPSAQIFRDFRDAQYLSFQAQISCASDRLHATVLPIGVCQCIVEYALSNEEVDWRVLKAKTNEMRSSTPRPVYLRSAVSREPQRPKYPGWPELPRELSSHISRTRMS